MKNPRFRSILLLVCIMTVANDTLARTSVVKYISNIDGLSNNSVNSIIEDKQHTIWIGTWGGLNAYNGRDIKVFRYNASTTNSLSNNVVRQIIEADNDLWIATDNGINRLDKRTGSILRYYPGGSHSRIPRTEKTFTIAKGSDGHIYCWVKNRGLFRFGNNHFAFIHTDFGKNVRDCCTNGDRLIFLCADGSLRYCQTSKTYGAIRLSNLNVMASGISSISRTGAYAFALSGDNRVTVFDQHNRAIRSIQLPRGLNISQIVYNGSSLYIGLIGGGCKIFSISDSKLTDMPGIDAHSSILTLYQGSQNILWLGTDGRGLGQTYSYDPVFRSVLFSFPVRCFSEYKKGEMLVGTKGAGLQILNTATCSLSPLASESSGLSSNSVYALKRNSLGDIFIGSDGYGIDILDSKTNRLHKLVIPSKYPKFKSVYNICFSNQESVLWAATAGYGLIRMGISRQCGRYVVGSMKCFSSTNRSNPLNNDIIYALAPDANSRYIWFGSRGGGANRLDISNSAISGLEALDSRTSLTNDDVLCLCPDGRDLWIGTSYGLNLMRHQTAGYGVVRFSARALDSKTIHGIVRDLTGQIWVSTNDGLYKIGRDGRVENYTMNDGLQNNEFSDGAYDMDSSGMLYFGGVNGLSYFNPQMVRPRRFKPFLELSSLRINNRDVAIASIVKDGILSFGYEERDVAFRFIAKDYINTSSCEYAYRLDGMHRWAEMGTTPDIVLQLSPGRHVLEVRCANSDKIWSDHILRLNIHVDAPWWFGTWAILSYVLFLTAVITASLFVLRNRIRTRRQLFLAEMNKKQDQKIFESKLTFFTNVAHELITPLTLIYTPAQYLADIPGLDNGIKKYVRIIKENAGKMQKMMQELIEYRKDKSNYEPLCPEKVNIIDFIPSITNEYKTTSIENKIIFDVNIHDAGMTESDKSVLGKIVFDLISYTFCHTISGGIVTFECYQENGDYSLLHILLKYTGKDAASQQIKEIFNIYKIFDGNKTNGDQLSNGISINLIKKMLEYIGGNIDLSARSGKFVEMHITVPSLDTSRPGLIMLDHESKPSQQKSINERKKNHGETGILIVSDEQDLIILLDNILYDYTVNDFHDTKAVLEYISQNHPDVIIVDFHLGKEAFALISELKNNTKTNFIPTIGLSGKSSVEEQIDAYNEGIDIYIEKPFHPRQILSSIENLITRQSLLKDYFNSSISSLTIKDGKILHEEDRILINKINDFINEHIDDEEFSPETIESFLGLSKASFYRKFKELVDMTPSEYIKSVRLNYAARMLRTTKMTVSEIIYKSGFSNKSYFYREFKDTFHCSPNDYRRT